MALRRTCLRCEQNDGVSTPLVPNPSTKSWAHCPIHEPQWVEALTPPTFQEALQHAGLAPELMDKGIRGFR